MTEYLQPAKADEMASFAGVMNYTGLQFERQAYDSDLGWFHFWDWCDRRGEMSLEQYIHEVRMSNQGKAEVLEIESRACNWRMRKIAYDDYYVKTANAHLKRRAAKTLHAALSRADTILNRIEMMDDDDVKAQANALQTVVRVVSLATNALERTPLMQFAQQNNFGNKPEKEPEEEIKTILGADWQPKE